MLNLRTSGPLSEIQRVGYNSPIMDNITDNAVNNHFSYMDFFGTKNKKNTLANDIKPLYKTCIMKYFELFLNISNTKNSNKLFTPKNTFNPSNIKQSNLDISLIPEQQAAHLSTKNITQKILKFMDIGSPKSEPIKPFDKDISTVKTESKLPDISSQLLSLYTSNTWRLAGFFFLSATVEYWLPEDISLFWEKSTSEVSRVTPITFIVHT